MGGKTWLLVWHSQPAQRTHSVTPGENDSCVQVSRYSGCIQSQTGIMGAMSEQLEFLMFWTFKEILKETEPGPSFSQLDVLSPVLAFKRVWALLPYHERPLGWKGMDARWISFVHCRRGSAAWDRKGGGLKSRFKLQITLYLYGIHVFQVHNSMICINFTEWCDHPHKLVLEHLCSPHKTPSCPFQLILDPLFVPRKLLIYFLHSYTGLFWTFHI